MAKDLKEQLLEKPRDCTCFGLQLDESVDVSGEAQLLVYCRFPDVNSSKISEHMVFCDPVGANTTGKSIFTKLDNFFYNRKTPMETLRCSNYRWSSGDGRNTQRVECFY